MKHYQIFAHNERSHMFVSNISTHILCGHMKSVQHSMSSIIITSQTYIFDCWYKTSLKRYFLWSTTLTNILCLQKPHQLWSPYDDCKITIVPISRRCESFFLFRCSLFIEIVAGSLYCRLLLLTAGSCSTIQNSIYYFYDIQSHQFHHV